MKISEDGASSARFAEAVGVPSVQNAFWVSLFSIPVRQNFWGTFLHVTVVHLAVQFNLTKAKNTVPNRIVVSRVKKWKADTKTHETWKHLRRFKTNVNTTGK
jgi:hypothetical protein